MAVFSRYKQVLEQNGSPMSVRTALQLINQALDEILTEQEGDYDPHTRWALTWYEQRGFEEGPFGEADVLARAKDCSITALVEAGVLSSRAGKVRLLRRDELAPDWSPPPGRQPFVWVLMQHLIRALEKDGEAGAAAILRQVPSLGEIARELAYRLYSTCERKKWAEEARAYNGLVLAWPHIQQLTTEQPSSTPSQRSLYDADE
jgi:putative DNA methylase